jgi:hypothetical protein
MEYDKGARTIILNREISKLDDFVVNFCKNLADYVIVSGYVSIVFGRSRATEDVDLLAKIDNKKEFFSVWNRLKTAGFECINTSSPDEAFEMLKDFAIRFSEEGKPIPNIEFKIIKTEIEEYSFDNRIKLQLKNSSIFISPIEMQIAYKLMLGKNGNKKDIEDAKHLYELFREKIDDNELKILIKKLNVLKEFEMIK